MLHEQRRALQAEDEKSLEGGGGGGGGKLDRDHSRISFNLSMFRFLLNLHCYKKTVLQYPELEQRSIP